MNFKKIGTRIINMDMVTNINLDFRNSSDHTGIRIYFGAESETFYGDEAVRLAAYLDDIAIAIMPPRNERGEA